LRVAMVATAASIIYGLPRMRFRGLNAPPYDVAGFDFQHSHGERGYPFVDGEAHEWTGLNAKRLQFTLYFVNTLEADSFPKAWNGWQKALFNGAPGELVHPLLGPVQAIVRGGSVQLAAQLISGIVVNVQFSTTIKDPSEKRPDFVVKAKAAGGFASAADNAAAAAGIPYPEDMPGPSLLDMIKQIDGLIFLLKNEALGLIAQVQGIIDFMVAFIDENRPDHLAIQARDALVSLWVSLSSLAEAIGANAARKVGSESLANATTLEAFARRHNNTLGDAVDLNPWALGGPEVPKGATLKFYV
jgi:prophage DNA circulation protein